MTPPAGPGARARRVQRLILDLVPPGERRARGQILAEVARALGSDPQQRKLRMLVAAALDELLRAGVLVDGGPEVYRR